MGEDVLGKWAFCVLQDGSRFQLGSQTHDSNELHAPCGPQARFWQQGNPGRQDESAEVAGPVFQAPLLMKGKWKKQNETAIALKHGTRNKVSLILFPF